MVPSQTHPVKLAFPQFTAVLRVPGRRAHRRGADSTFDKARESTTDRIPTVRNLRHLTWCARSLKTAKQFDQAVLAAFGYDLDPAVEKIFRGAEQPELKRIPANPPAEANALHPAAYPGGQPRLATRRVDAR